MELVNGTAEADGSRDGPELAESGNDGEAIGEGGGETRQRQRIPGVQGHWDDGEARERRSSTAEGEGSWDGPELAPIQVRGGEPGASTPGAANIEHGTSAHWGQAP